MVQPSRPNQILPTRPEPNPPRENKVKPLGEKEDEEKKPFAGENSGSDDEVKFVVGYSYCCGLWNTGDSICLNLCKVGIVFVVCPLMIFWMYKSGSLDKLLEKAGAVSSKGCECCTKCCATVSAKLNGSCLDKLCNTDNCKHCCGI